MSLLQIEYFRVYLRSTRGLADDTGLRLGLTSEGTLLVPARAVGISDDYALRCAGCEFAPVVLEGDGTIYLDIQHAIDFFPDEASKAALRRIRDRMVEELRR